MISEKKSRAFLRRQAAEVRNYRILKRIIPTILGLIALLLVITYVVSIMYTRFGSFTISVNKFNHQQYGLSLSEDRYFSSPTSMLDCRAAEEITNIDGRILDEYDLGAIDGNDSGDNYICYTFYCKNAGTETLSFEYGINITSMTLDIEKAVRIRLMTNINGENPTKTDYARANGVDELGNSIPEPNTTPFFSKTTVTKQMIEEFKPDDMMKFTVVIWLEGNDPDCIDAILGGVMKLEMKFNVLASDEEKMPSGYWHF